MSEAHANVVQNAQPNADASNPSSSKKSRQNITNDIKKAIVDGINTGTITLNPRSEKSTFLVKYIKRIKY